MMSHVLDGDKVIIKANLQKLLKLYINKIVRNTERLIYKYNDQIPNNKDLYESMIAAINLYNVVYSEEISMTIDKFIDKYFDSFDSVILKNAFAPFQFNITK